MQFVAPFVSNPPIDSFIAFWCSAQGQSGMAETSRSCDLEALGIATATTFEEMGSEDFASGHSGGFVKGFKKWR